VLLMDYDHKNGVPCINSKENCQALSVITHAIKTRCPEVFEGFTTNPTERIRFIVDLLNCMTRSKYFIEACGNGDIQIKNPHQQQLSIVRDGLFFTSSKE